VGIMQGVPLYDLLEDLGKVKADIIIKQLLGIAPQCRSLLQANLIRKRAKLLVNEISLSPNPGAPTIDVQIDDLIVSGVQIDGGSSVNLMNRDTMLSLHLTSLQETKLVLRMADQSRVKPLGILPKVKTSISGIVYLIDFIVFQPSTNNASYPILLGHPWLYQAQAKDDWGRGTLTTGRGPSKIKLNMYPSRYQGETQWQSPEVTSDQGYITNGEDFFAKRIFIKPKASVQPFNP
jgi:hypothetical protein